MVNAFRGIVAREGTRGLFAGYGSFLLRDLPFDAIEFVAYEQLKKAYAVSFLLLRPTLGGHTPQRPAPTVAQAQLMHNLLCTHACAVP